MEGESRDTASRLGMFVSSLTQPPHPEVVQLSSLLGMACLHHTGLPAAAERLNRENPHWGPSVQLWLKGLADGKRYPYPPQDMDLSTLR